MSRTRIAQHTFNGAEHGSLTMTALSKNDKGHCPLIRVVIESPGGDSMQIDVPAISGPAFADVMRIAYDARTTDV